MKIGPYHLISELGSGGMAQVWLAHRVWEDGTRRSVVFKFTRRKGAADEGTLRQLVEEGRLSILLSHNNIVSTIDVGTHERVPYLVMEYIPGRDLAQLMLATARTGGGWDVETAVYVVREVAQALKYAHELERDGVHQQIIHRDVSSKNVMIDGSGGVRLMDFGVATSLHTRTSRIHVKGTLHYMAPEHYLARASTASDVFGLGVVFWEMLSGRKCRENLENEALISKVVSGEVGDLGRELPPQVQRVLDGMLDPNEASRITLPKLLHALKDFPSRRTELEDMLATFFGRIGKRTGLSQVHFAASKELADTFAVAKAADVSLSGLHERKLPGQPDSIPADFVRSEIPTTSRVDPLAVADALDDDVDGDDDEGERGTVRTLASSPIEGTKVAKTVRLPANIAASSISGDGRETSAAPSPTALLPRAGAEQGQHPGLRPSSAPPVATVRASSPDTSGAVKRRRWVPLIVMIAAAIVAGLSIAAWLARPGEVEVARGEGSGVVPELEFVAVSGPPSSTGATRVEFAMETDTGATDRSGGVENTRGEVAIATSENPVISEEEPPPEVRVEPTPKVAAPKPSTKPKRRVPKLEFVVRRGLAVEFAELRVGRGKVHVVPARGAVSLRLPPGMYTVRYRSEAEGPWRSKRQTFSSGMKYAANVERSGLRITAAPDEARSR